MPFNQKLAIVMCLALAGLASPVHSSRSFSARAQPDGHDSILLYQPTMYQVFPVAASQSSPPVSQLEVLRTGNTSVLENIAVFEGIPANARTCVLGWAQAAKADRAEFAVARNGLLAAQQISHLPGEDVSWENIAPIVEEAVEQGMPLLHPETTGWPDIHTAAGHIAGYIDCAETIYLKIQIDDRGTDGFVYLGQDDKDGLTLEVQVQ
ncbi:hypothetical protein E0Z10_g10056 [Xylaria hypoxylon]|uniref:Uncharacterized protein n=1 Tax=Xylaria hypoxylon TaxID=37992 RepID=A0A4Z0YIF7_9PEZI|nr:hypothetical protein E0Z10_g10056 [Xylaria hypoxylon]